MAAPAEAELPREHSHALVGAMTAQTSGAGTRGGGELPNIKLASVAKPRAGLNDYDEVYDPDTTAAAHSATTTPARLKAAEEDYGGDYGEIFNPEHTAESRSGTGGAAGE